MGVIVRLKDGSAAYRHQNADAQEEYITLEDKDNGTPTLRVAGEGVGGQVARYRLEAIEYWTTGVEIDPATAAPENTASIR